MKKIEMRYIGVSRQYGFTLIQLITTLSIAAILAVMAAPSFNNSIQNNKLKSSATSLTSELELARSEAIKRNMPITICGSTDSTTCNTNDWELGRILFLDDGAGTASNASNGVIDGETILKSFGPYPTGVTITPTLFTTSGYIIFSGDGTVNTSGTMVICDSRGTADSTLIRAINVTVVGQTRNAYDSDATTDDIVNNINGANVTCS